MLVNFPTDEMPTLTNKDMVLLKDVENFIGIAFKLCGCYEENIALLLGILGRELKLLGSKMKKKS